MITGLAVLAAGHGTGSWGIEPCSRAHEASRLGCFWQLHSAPTLHMHVRDALVIAAHPPSPAGSPSALPVQEFCGGETVTIRYNRKAGPLHWLNIPEDDHLVLKVGRWGAGVLGCWSRG